MSLFGRKKRIIKNEDDAKIVSPPTKDSRFSIGVFPNRKQNYSPMPTNIVKEVNPDKIDKVRATSIVNFYGETYNPYNLSKFRSLYNYDEPSFYNDYDNSYLQNPYSKMVIEYLMNELFAYDYHCEGPGAKEVEDFFKLDNTRDKVKIMVREGLKKGNGFMDITAKGGKGKRTRVIDTNTLLISMDLQTGLRTYYQSGNTLNEKYLLHFMTHERPYYAYGVSLLRANIVYLTALLDTGGDSVAALKRVAYAPIIAELDLEGIPDSEKDAKLLSFSKHLEEIQSATNNMAIDKRNKITLLGEGGGNARLLPTNQIIEPILSVVLINFGIPLGIYIQTGANKSIITEQRLAMQRFYDDLRGKIKYAIESKIIPMITSAECSIVFNKPPITAPESQEAFKLHISAFEKGLLTREYILDYWDIDDKGTTFAPPPTGQFGQPSSPKPLNQTVKPTDKTMKPKDSGNIG